MEGRKSMKIKKGLKRVISFTLAAAMAVGLVVTGGGGRSLDVEAAGENLPDIMDAASQVNYATILGRAMDFGIVANDFTQNGHMETTIAAGSFHNPNNANNDIDFLPGTAQVMFGEADDMSIKFGVASIDNLNIEIGKSIASNSITAEGVSQTNSTLDYIRKINTEIRDANDGYYQVDGQKYYTNVKFNGDFFKVLAEGGGAVGAQRSLDNLVNVSVTTNDSTKSNIATIVNSVKKKSSQLAVKANDNKYKLPLDYFSANSSTITIDLSSEDFKNKVVYINVDDVNNIGDSKLSLKDRLGGSEKVEIKKDSSTIVVFSYGKDDNDIDSVTNTEDITVGKIKVTLTDQDNKVVDSSTSSNGKHAKVNGQTSEDVDQEICQKIIYNLRTTGKVDIIDAAGTFLAPYSNEVKNSGGASAGWVVANKMENGAEWHFIYSGGNQNIIDDGEGEFHFALRKAFTKKWNGENTVEDQTISAGVGEYKFELYKTRSDYSTEGITPIIMNGTNYIQNDGTSYVKFPKLKFYNSTDNAPAGTDPDYIVTPADTAGKKLYYVIKESGAGTTNVDGVQKSNGFINVELLVTNDDGTLNYKFKQETHLGDSSNSIYEKDNDYIPKSGPEYKLGAFFNLKTDVVPETGSIKVLKTTDNAPSGHTNEYSFIIQTNSSDADKKYVIDEYGNLGNIPTSFIVEADQTGEDAGTIIEGLPLDLRYTVTEVAPTNLGDAYECVTTYTNNEDIELTKDEIHKVGIKNTYNKITGSITVSKVVPNVTGDVTLPTSYSFYLKSGSQYVQDSDITTFGPKDTAKRFSVNPNESTVVPGLMIKDYTVEEAEFTVPNGYKCNTTYSYGDNDTDNSILLTKDNPSGVAKITNTFTKEETVKLTVTKTVTADSGTIAARNYSFKVKNADEERMEQ